MCIYEYFQICLIRDLMNFQYMQIVIENTKQILLNNYRGR